MTPEPGASAFQRLREVEEGFGLLRRALDAIADENDRHARLSKAAVARAGQLEEDLHALVALLPKKPGRQLEKTRESFLQEIRRLKTEEGWGRPRIVEAMRDRGVTEWEVRRALTDLAGEKPGSRRD